MINGIISIARSIRYWAMEPIRLRIERMRHRNDFTASAPFVSIILPTFNRVDLLFDRALPSVLRQTFGNFELIVCAHGCTDDTVERVKRIPDKRVRLIEIARRQTYKPTAMNHWLAGPVVPITAGLKAARGKWIARIDDDDIWTRGHLAVLLERAICEDFEFVSSAYEKVTADGQTQVVLHDHGTPPIGGVQTWLYRSYLKFMLPNPDCWRKRCNRVNDTDLAQRFRNAGVRIGHINDVTAIIMPRPGETEIGSKAYISDAAHTESKFAFH